MRSGVIRALLRLCDTVAAAASWLAAVMAMVMIAALLLQIFFRYVVGHALTGSEEVALLMFAWVTLLLAGVGVRDGLHVRLTIGLALLPAVLRRGIEHLLMLSICAFAVFLMIGGWNYIAETRGQVSAATGYPIEILHASAFVCGALILLQAVGWLVRDFCSMEQPRSETPQ